MDTTKLRSNFVQEALLFLLFWPGPALLLLLLVLLNLYITICLGSVLSNLTRCFQVSLLLIDYWLVLSICAMPWLAAGCRFSSSISLTTSDQNIKAKEFQDFLGAEIT